MSHVVANGEEPSRKAGQATYEMTAEETGTGESHRLPMVHPPSAQDAPKA